MQFKNIQVITFDAGGTLLYPHPSVGEIYSEVMKSHRLHLEPKTLDLAFKRAWKETHLTPRIGVNEENEKDWWRSMVRRTLEGLGEPADFETLFEELWVAFAAPDRWRLHVGAEETLLGLKQRGYRLAILSNWDKRLRGLLQGLQLTPFFDEIVISSEVGFEKPDPSIFRAVEERFKVDSKSILHVGDSIYHDRDGAHAVGWNSLIVTHQNSSNGTESEIACLQDLLNRL